MRERAIVLVTIGATLLACPEERPGAAKEIPPQRVPPAMSLEAPPAAAERVPAPAPASPPDAAPAPLQPPAPPTRRR